MLLAYINRQAKLCNYQVFRSYVRMRSTRTSIRGRNHMNIFVNGAKDEDLVLSYFDHKFLRLTLRFQSIFCEPLVPNPILKFDLLESNKL